MDFHVGDFVKLRKGGFGYIDRICDDNIFSWKCVYGPYAGEDFFGDVATKDFKAVFEQVGTTIFEQKYKPIEPLNLIGGLVGATDRKISSKVDELVRAVNKINEQLAKER